MSGEEDGGLELESPAELAAGGAQDDEDGDDGPEGDENAEGVDPAVGAEAVAFLLRGLDEREAFDEEDGEDAGHEVEEDAADEGEACGSERLRRSHVGAVGAAGGECARSGVDFVCGTVGEFKQCR